MHPPPTTPPCDEYPGSFSEIQTRRFSVRGLLVCGLAAASPGSAVPEVVRLLVAAGAELDRAGPGGAVIVVMVYNTTSIIAPLSLRLVRATSMCDPK